MMSAHSLCRGLTEVSRIQVAAARAPEGRAVAEFDDVECLPELKRYMRFSALPKTKRMFPCSTGAE